MNQNQYEIPGVSGPSKNYKSKRVLLHCHTLLVELRCAPTLIAGLTLPSLPGLLTSTNLYAAEHDGAALHPLLGCDNQVRAWHQLAGISRGSSIDGDSCVVFGALKEDWVAIAVLECQLEWRQLLACKAKVLLSADVLLSTLMKKASCRYKSPALLQQMQPEPELFGHNKGV